jgi:hypothetical protein
MQPAALHNGVTIGSSRVGLDTTFHNVKVKTRLNYLQLSIHDGSIDDSQCVVHVTNLTPPRSECNGSVIAGAAVVGAVQRSAGRGRRGAGRVPCGAGRGARRWGSAH